MCMCLCVYVCMYVCAHVCVCMCVHPSKNALARSSKKRSFFLHSCKMQDLLSSCGTLQESCRNLGQDSCKIPQDLSRSCKISQDLAWMQEKWPFLGKILQERFTATCVYVCVYVCGVCPCHVCMRVCVYVYMCVHACVYVCLCKYIDFIYIYIVYVSIIDFIYIKSIYTYIHILVHTYT